MASGINKKKYQKPNFLIVGAAKSGTTSLAMYLNQHPDIFIPKQKELRFFVKDTLLKISDDNPLKEHILKTSILEEQEYFNTYNVKEKRAGDASIHYLYHYDEAIPKIKHFIGDVPIIIILRDPIQRLVSNYKFNKYHHNNTIQKELELEEYRINNQFNSFWFYQKLGMYHKQVKAYLDNFSKVEIIIFEDFINMTENIVTGLVENLGLEPIKIDYTTKHNISKEKNYFHRILEATKIKKLVPKSLKKNRLIKNLLHKKIEHHTHEKVLNNLYSNFKSDIAKLESLISRDLSIWKK